MSTKAGSLVVSLVLAVLVSVHGQAMPSVQQDPGNSQGGALPSHHGSPPPHPGPPPQAAANFSQDPGNCVRFLSVFVPAQGGHYVVGVSFAYMDMNHDGHYTPGIDKLEVCVNCPDACGWGP